MTLYLLAEINYTFGLGEKLLELDGKSVREKGPRRRGAAAGLPTKPFVIESGAEEEDLF
jgi:hypothetical protein